MIIKRVNIISFGALKNKIIDFEDGINVIYGENEAGKSTIQSFIKIWLYGFSNSRGRELKTNERLKFMPISGEFMRGQLHIIYNEKEYVINRTFGKTKKDDTSAIIDGLTGEEVKYIPSIEPGKYFLGVNSSTFVRTLFIGQLNVEVKKDKDEEILDKISNSVGVGEGDITVDKAFAKLENYKKSLSNGRKNGIIDKLKDDYSNLLSERLEGYKLSEKSLDNEKTLIDLNDEKEALVDELKNLEIYKKYMKKKKLKKEYEDISKYLRKKEELQKEEKSIENSLIYDNEMITLDFINDIKEEHSMYLSLLDTKEEEKNKLTEKFQQIDSLKAPIVNYIDSNIFNEKLYKDIDRLKLEQDMLEEKVSISNKLEKEIAFLKMKEKEAKELAGSTVNIGDIRNEVSEDLKLYEEKLKELKYILELGKSHKSNSSKNIINILCALLSIILAFGVIFFDSIVLKSISIVGILLFFIIIILNIFNNSKSQGKREKILQDEIKSIEKRLDLYIKQIEVNDYSELLKKVKLYDDYIIFKEKIDIKIDEKLSQVKLLDLNNAKEIYLNNKEKINKYLELFEVDTIDQLLQVIKSYEGVMDSIKVLEIEVKNQKERLKSIYEQIQIREEKIIVYLKKLQLNNINLLDLGDKLLELNEKIIKKDEIHRSLISMDETYSALSNGKDINLIKEELKDIINISFNYSYETEEEIDSVAKVKSNRLLEVEKDIKDVENAINNRFKGKRRIPEIEEDIISVESKIKENQKILEGTNLAYEILKESYSEIRESFGPLLNKNVAKAFREITNERYNEVLVSDKYEMKLVAGHETFSSQLLSSGANDQLYLALRLAFIKMIFNKKDLALYFDDAFVQYDDNRVEKVLSYLIEENFIQSLIFTCQKREASILDSHDISYSYIKL